MQKHPHRFAGCAAAVALHDLDGALAEIRRAMEELGAKGIQVYSNIGGRPLDEERFKPVFSMMDGYGLPIWLHPARPSRVTDYAAEERSRYEMWWARGWPYDTSGAMARRALGGRCDRHPEHGEMIPEVARETLAGFDSMFLACIGDANKVEDHISLQMLLTIRKGFDQYVNLRPIKV